MAKYVALLRGINVGGNNKVEMYRLKKVFEVIGHSNVVSYINSGNVVFESNEKNIEKLITHIEKAIKKEFGFEVKTIVRDNKSIQRVCKATPLKWKNDLAERTEVLFLWDEYDTKKSLDLLVATKGVDTLLYTKGAIIWNMDKKHYTKSGLRKLIGTKLYKNMTARNINTVRKLEELMRK